MHLECFAWILHQKKAKRNQWVQDSQEYYLIVLKNNTNSWNFPTKTFIGLLCNWVTPPLLIQEFSSTLKSEEDAVYSTGDGTKQDNRCFNCSGDHTMMNCPFPKNQKEISKNRSMFLKHQPRM